MLDQDITESIKASLMGKVFHATTIEALDKIKNSGFIAPNLDNEFDSPFGRYNGYFKNKGCVSFFDYRPNEQLENYIHKCFPTQIFEKSAGLVILELSSNRYPHLVNWENWKKEGSGFQIVPYVETAIKGIVNLSDISDIRIIDRPESFRTRADFYRSLK
jgi:hypothetical protein